MVAMIAAATFRTLLVALVSIRREPALPPLAVRPSEAVSHQCTPPFARDAEPCPAARRLHCGNTCQLTERQPCMGSEGWRCPCILLRGHSKPQLRCRPRRPLSRLRPARRRRGFFAQAGFRTPRIHWRSGRLDAELALAPRRLAGDPHRPLHRALLQKAPGGRLRVRKAGLHADLRHRSLCIRTHPRRALRMHAWFLRQAARCPSTCPQDHLRRRRLRGLQRCSLLRRQNGAAVARNVEDPFSICTLHGGSNGAYLPCSHSLGLSVIWIAFPLRPESTVGSCMSVST